MFEDRKLQEAAYFLARMESSVNEPEVFGYNLSAFLSAARSVAQYALKEARTKVGGRAWYDAFVEHDDLIRFFAAKRDANIHDQPVPLDGHVDVFVKDGDRLTERASVEKFDRDGNLVEVFENDSSEADMDAKWTPDFAFVPHYLFAEWHGSAEIPELCGRYLAALRGLVADGRARTFLSSPEHAA